MRSLEELEHLFDSLKSGQEVRVGFWAADKPDAIFPIDFRVKGVDYSLFLSVEGIHVPLHIDPGCVVGITTEGGRPTIWLGACGPAEGADGSLIFFDTPNSPMFRISMEIL